GQAIRPGSAEELSYGPTCAAAIQQLWRNHTWVEMGDGGPSSWADIPRVLRYTTDSMIDCGQVEFLRNRFHGDLAALDSAAAAHEPTSTAGWVAFIRSGHDGMLLTGHDPLDWQVHPTARGDSNRKYERLTPAIVGSDAIMIKSAITVIPGFSLHQILESFVLY